MEDSAAVHIPSERISNAVDDAERANRLVRRVLALVAASIVLVASILIGVTFSTLDHNLTCQASAYRAVIADLNARTVAAKHNLPPSAYPTVPLPPRC